MPCAGGIVSSIWWLVATIIGLSKVHRTEGWRAAVAVLLPVFVCMGIVIALYIAIIAAVVGFASIMRILSRKIRSFLSAPGSERDRFRVSFSVGLLWTCGQLLSST